MSVGLGKSVSLLARALIMVIIIQQASQVHGANILGIFTSHSPSHLIIHMSVVKALAEKGHNVTVVSILKPTFTHKNIHHIIIPLTEEQEQINADFISNVAAKKNGFVSAFRDLLNSMEFYLNLQYDATKDDRFRAIYENPHNKFDLVILGHFRNDYQFGIAAKLKCPVIVSWVGPPMQTVNELVGNPAEVSYVPNLNIGVKPEEIMTFKQRMQNFFTELSMDVYGLILDYRLKKIYTELFGNDNLPSYKEAKKNVSLVFCNSHFSEGAVRPNVPAIIEIGGIQIKEKPNPLPEDINKFLNASKEHGAILLSLGSNLKSSSIKSEVIQSLFNTLSSLKQKVIWKWEDMKNLPGKSGNILYKKWLPQDDILAHPNVKLFITHAGKGGVVEAQYHGVPMIALPVYADQPGNAQTMVSSGYGLQLDILTLKEAKFKQAVQDVLTNSTYVDNVRRFSELYRDRPLSAKENVVYWSEYVIRHHGAVNMQSPLVQMNLIESWNLDVLLIVRLIPYLMWKMGKFIYKSCKKSGKKQVDEDKEKKNK